MRVCKPSPDLENLDIRIYIMQSNLWHKQVAEAMGVSPKQFSHMLSKELTPTDKSCLREIIDGLRGGRADV